MSLLIYSFLYSDYDDESIQNLISPTKRPRSLIAQLAEGRKAQKSIYSFGPVAAVPVKASAPSLGNRSSENPDLLGSILACQSQLTTFGKSAEVVRSKPRNTNSNRVLGAILASQATLNRLDETLRCLEQRNQAVCSASHKPKAITTQKSTKISSVPPSDSTGQGSSTDQQQSGGSSNGESSSTKGGLAGTQTNGQSCGEATANSNGVSGGDDGNGEDRNQDRKKKPQPEDKKDDEEDDVDLYSDIESNEEENDPPDGLPKIEVSTL